MVLNKTCILKIQIIKPVWNKHKSIFRVCKSCRKNIKITFVWRTLIFIAMIFFYLVFTYSFDWFADLGLKWYCLPAVSGMMFDCGGIQFTACPFNGWYMSSEIGCRNLCDTYRYNVLDVCDNFLANHAYTIILNIYFTDTWSYNFQEVLDRMKIELKNYGFLKKDRALVEVNLAVLYSFQVSWFLLILVLL